MYHMLQGMTVHIGGPYHPSNPDSSFSLRHAVRALIARDSFPGTRGTGGWARWSRNGRMGDFQPNPVISDRCPHRPKGSLRRMRFVLEPLPRNLGWSRMTILLRDTWSVSAAIREVFRRPQITISMQLSVSYYLVVVRFDNSIGATIRAVLILGGVR